MFQRWAASLFLLFTLFFNAQAADSASVAPDSLARKASLAPAPVHYRWPVDSTNLACRAPLEITEDCWRSSPHWAVQSIGFPGARSATLSLSSLDKVQPSPFFQPTLSASPYGLGGYLPFDRVNEADLSEPWMPVLPVDTPITSLHWERGALQLNQFTVNLRRMVGDRAYLGLQIQSDQSTSQFYQYSFNVHQPYLAGWGIAPLKRDSASLVIQDTSQKVNALQIRPRLGFWIDSQTVMEVYADWFDNSSSLANPTHPAKKDSLQLLYPALFSSASFGAVAARSTERHQTRLFASHSEWTRELHPNGTNAAQFSEAASGSLEKLRVDWTPLAWSGKPQLGTEVDVFKESDYWLKGTGGTVSEAWSHREHVDVESKPVWNSLSFGVNASAAHRTRADKKEEWLGKLGGMGEAKLPLGFLIKAQADETREGADEALLFRWQPALGLYPNPDLKPRTDLHLGAGVGWESRHLGFGIGWEQHRFENNWLPRILPKAGVCVDADSSHYPSERQPVCVLGRVPDSLALQQVNYREENRGILQASAFAAAGNWRLSLLNTYLRASSIRDDRLGFTGQNWQLPDRVFKAQLLWKRKLINQKLGLQTQWDWEWCSTRTVFASDLDGYSRAVKLDEYLALDFTVRMEIKSFMLYFRTMNLNHDRYATEPGVHPPGVNFRFGIDWKLLN